MKRFLNIICTLPGVQTWGATPCKLDYDQQWAVLWARASLFPAAVGSLRAPHNYRAFCGLKTRNKILFWRVTHGSCSIICMLLFPAEFCNAGSGTASQSHFKIRFKLQGSLWLFLFLTERRPTRNLTNEILPVWAEILYRCRQGTTLSVVGKVEETVQGVFLLIFCVCVCVWLSILSLSWVLWHCEASAFFHPDVASFLHLRAGSISSLIAHIYHLSNWKINPFRHIIPCTFSRGFHNTMRIFQRIPQ